MSQQGNVEIVHVHGGNMDTYIDDVVPLFHLYTIFYKQSYDIAQCKEWLTRRLSTGSNIFLVYHTPADDAVKVTGDNVEGTTEGPSVESDKKTQRSAIGFTQLHPMYSSVNLEENWLLSDLYIREEYRALKLGQKLISHALTWGEQTGAFSMKIETTLHNPRAQYLYPKMGFVEYTRYGDMIEFSHKFPRALTKEYKSYYD